MTQTRGKVEFKRHYDKSLSEEDSRTIVIFEQSLIDHLKKFLVVDETTEFEGSLRYLIKNGIITDFGREEVQGMKLIAHAIYLIDKNKTLNVILDGNREPNNVRYSVRRAIEKLGEIVESYVLNVTIGVDEDE